MNKQMEAKMLKNDMELYLFYKIIRFLEYYALFLQPDYKKVSKVSYPWGRGPYIYNKVEKWIIYKYRYSI